MCNWIDFTDNEEPSLSANTLNNLQTYIKNAIENVKKDAHPIGSIYISKESTNPNEVFGFGTWEAIANDYLLNFITSGTSGTSGSSNTTTNSHTLTSAQSGLPSHHHAMNKGYYSYQANQGNYIPSGGTKDVYFISGNQATTTDVSANASQGHSHGLNLKKYNVYGWVRTA